MTPNNPNNPSYPDRLTTRAVGSGRSDNELSANERGHLTPVTRQTMPSGKGPGKGRERDRGRDRERGKGQGKG
jgi:hypothetical protein